MASSRMWATKGEILKIIDESIDITRTSNTLINILKSQSLIPLPNEDKMSKRWSEVLQLSQSCNRGPWTRGHGEDDISYFGRTSYYRVCGITYGLSKVDQDKKGWWCKELVSNVIGYGLWHDQIGYRDYENGGWKYHSVQGVVEYLDLLTTIRDALKKEVVS
jgi:hypothetical protein